MHLSGLLHDLGPPGWRCAELRQLPFMCTYDGMQQGLRTNYIALAEWNDSYTAPVGAAWKAVRDAHPTISLYDADGSHPSPAGTYLAACVFYCTLYQESCAGATFNGSSMPERRPSCAALPAARCSTSRSPGTSMFPTAPAHCSMAPA